MNPFGLGASSLELKTQRCLTAFLKKIGNVEFSARFDTRTRIKIKLKDGAIPDISE